MLGALRRSKTRTFNILLQDLDPERGGDPATLHQRIAVRARAQHVDQVVWTMDSCGSPFCEFAWHAVVPNDPTQPLQPTRGGSQEDDRSAVLSQVAYGAAAFGEASYHLRTWAASPTGGLTPEGLLLLADAEQKIGQLDRARMWLRQLDDEIDVDDKPEHLLPYYRARTRVACGDENLKELESLQRMVEKRVGERPELKYAQLDAMDCRIRANLQTAERAATSPLIEQALALARELGDQGMIGRLEGYLAQLAEHAGEFDKGEQHLQKALEQAVAAGDKDGQAHSRIELARNRMLAGEFTKAHEHARSALETYKELEDETGIVECLPVLVRVIHRLSGTSAARAFLQTERGALKRHRLPRAELALRIAATYLELQAGELVRAGTSLKQLQVIVQKKKYASEELQILGMSAELSLFTGQTQRAHKAIDNYWRRADELARRSEQARARLLFAEFRLQEGNGKDARKLAEDAARRYREVDDQAGLASAEYVLGEIEREFGDIDVAKQRYQAAKAGFEQVRDIDGIRLVALGLATLGLWREATTQARQQLAPLVTYFTDSGNVDGQLRASLQLQWAKFLHSRDSAATLQSLRDLKGTAKQRRFAASEAEAQMLVACVYRFDADHIAAGRELRIGTCQRF